MEFLSVELIKEIAEKYGYLAVFLGIFFENLGIPLPGETITIVGGFLAGSGELNYLFVLASATFGAFIGGVIGYFVGKFGGWSLMLKLGGFFGVAEAKFLEIKSKFSENAVKAIFIGRFLAFFRIFVSPMAGVAEMPLGQFLVVNFASAGIWATVMTSLAFFVGKFVSLERLIALVGQFAVFAVFVVIAWIVVPIWLESRQAKLGE